MNKVTLFAVVALSAACYAGDSNGPKFRPDYTWEEKFNFFWRLHGHSTTWNTARQICEAEGAQLLMLRDYKVVKTLQMILTNMRAHFPAVYIGVHDQFAPGHFVDLIGREMKRTSATNLLWTESSPHNFDEKEHCVVLDREGFFADVNCEEHYPFICSIDKADLKDEEITVLSNKQQRHVYHVPSGTTDFHFKFKGVDAQIGLYYTPKPEYPTYEVIIGGWANFAFNGIEWRSSESQKKTLVHLKYNNIVSKNEFRDFWVSWKGNNVSAGHGNDSSPFIYLYLPELSSIKYVRIYSPGDAYWKIKGWKRVGTQSCYKLHPQPLTWYEAYLTCHSEMAHLAIMNSAAEADRVKDIFGDHPFTYAPDPNVLFLGFSDILYPFQYRTIYDQTLDEAGFSVFAHEIEDPDTMAEKRCGAMNKNGQLIMTWCMRPAMYICEKEISGVSLGDKIWKC